MSATKNHPSPSTTSFLLLPLALLTLGYMFYLNNFHVISFFCTLFSAFSTVNSTSKTPLPVDHADLNMFLGILTMPHLRKRRHLLCSVYALQTRNLTAAKVDVCFIFCNPIGDADKMHLALEITSYGDIIILDCVENINNGRGREVESVERKERDGKRAGLKRIRRRERESDVIVSGREKT
ncbi:beta-1,3-galactosyltransferase pvg3-like protein [Carex littledalei]|uniref:Beta-1,3-galactosyltransferase pvg3-like protein n=1 Tax=Carex littledalei TaxID=544730 RepID=A0A833QXJ9_9POAL|nr:beta-1,3-galactosyltransferase pvg3-like protein [Carex littledalei]